MPGDIVVGCGSSGSGLPARLICIVRISGKCSFQQYWDDPRFALKKPFLKGSRKRAYGDNIYHRDDQSNWLQARSHHSHPDGTLNQANLLRDTSSDNVLWGEDFAYFGRSAPLIPDHLRMFEGDDIYPTGRSHRSIFSSNFIAEVDTWFRDLSTRGYLGRPTSWI